MGHTLDRDGQGLNRIEDPVYWQHWNCGVRNWWSHVPSGDGPYLGSWRIRPSDTRDGLQCQQPFDSTSRGCGDSGREQGEVCARSGEDVKGQGYKYICRCKRYLHSPRTEIRIDARVHLVPQIGVMGPAVR